MLAMCFSTDEITLTTRGKPLEEREWRIQRTQLHRNSEDADVEIC